jgi:hypothetical protein
MNRTLLDYNSGEWEPEAESLLRRIAHSIMNFFGLGSFIGF